jgi:hypothetical protein
VKAADAAPMAKPADAAAPAAPDAAPAVSPKLRLVVDGAPREIASVIATPEHDGQVEVQITTFPYSCKEWVEGFRDTKFDDEITISLDFHPHLAPDGQRGWALVGGAFQSTTSSAQDGGEPFPGAVLDPSPGGKSTFEIVRDAETLGDPKRTMHLEGTVEALGCGPLRWKAPPPAPPPVLPGASLTVAGQAIPIGGAMVIAGKTGRQLVLSSSPPTCVEGSGDVDDDHFVSAGFSDVELTLTWSGKAKDADRGELGGELLGRGAAVHDWADGRLTATWKKPSKQATTVDVTLGGSTRIGDYPVAWSGTVTAQVCR